MKTSCKNILNFAMTAALLVTGVAHAEDIDIYQGLETGAAPNVVVILDNAAAASANSDYVCPSLAVHDPKANFGFEVCGLYSAVNGIATDPSLKGKINMGLMYFPGKSDGGVFVLPHPTPVPNSLVTLDDAGLGQMLPTISNLSLAKDKSNSNQFVQALQEAWAFFHGKTGLSGTKYPGLANAEACTRNFVVYITLATNNQKPQDGGKRGEAELATANGVLPKTIVLPPYQNPVTGSKASSKYQSDYSDEWARFMHNGVTSDGTVFSGITTYTITLYDGSNPDYEQLMKSVSINGGGKFHLVKIGDTAGLKDALRDIFQEMQAVNSVFAAPVLPVSANAQGTFDNQIFMGMFRPDPQANPRWMGNLKQYQFGVDITDPRAPQLFLGDASWGPYEPGADANRALSSAGTGFLSPNAVSFWTSKDVNTSPDVDGGFWANAVALQNAKDGFDAPDGVVVERGGVSQQLRLKYLSATAANNYRNIYTCAGNNCANGAALSTMPFTNTATAKTWWSGFTDMAQTAFSNLVAWFRGRDTAAQDADAGAGPEASLPPVDTITVRGSIHGDVLHSRPAVINYGEFTDANGTKIPARGTVVFYGSNDGLFRAINGNQPNNTTDPTKPKGNCTLSDDCSITVKDAGNNNVKVMPGGELWSFIPPEFFPKLERLHANAPTLKVGSASPADAQTKDYFFDGSPSYYRNASTGKTYLYLSARRGGRLLYALDVSDPANPKFMWKITHETNGFGELGQTWSQPMVAKVKGRTNPVLIFGAGYDPAEDKEPAETNTMGRGIFIIDAITGAKIWQAAPGGSANQCEGNPCQLSSMTHSIPADVTMIDRDFDGTIDRLYAADTGGKIWRVDLIDDGANGVSKWQTNLLADLGGSNATRRKFFFPPTVSSAGPGYDAVVAVTGDREHPLLANGAASVINRFYMIKDFNTKADGSDLKTNPIVPVVDGSSSFSSDIPAGLFNATTVSYQEPATEEARKAIKGLVVLLQNSGEKGVNAPAIFSGIAYFGTNQPKSREANVCQPNLGQARSYAVNFMTGQLNTTVLDGGGMPPSPVTGVVTVNVNGEERRLPFIIGGGGDSSDKGIGLDSRKDEEGGDDLNAWCSQVATSGSAADAKSALGARKRAIQICAKPKRTYWHRTADQSK